MLFHYDSAKANVYNKPWASSFAHSAAN